MLKIGIIGCGKITQVRHAPEYAENPDCELAAFYDFIPERAEEMVKEYGGTAYASVEALLDSGLDAVSVCVANADHAAVTLKALAKGLHVLCEKPMATTLQDCESMAKAAAESGRVLMLGHNQRPQQGAYGSAKAYRSRRDRQGHQLSHHIWASRPGELDGAEKQLVL